MKRTIIYLPDEPKGRKVRFLAPSLTTVKPRNQLLAITADHTLSTAFSFALEQIWSKSILRLFAIKPHVRQLQTQVLDRSWH